MDNSLGRKYSFGSLVKFSIPNIITMVFMSLYTIVDGVCVTAFVGTEGLSAVNIVYPMVSVELAISIMLAALGAPAGMLNTLCTDYFTILIAFAPAFLLQTLFQYALITAGKPALGMTMMILAGVTNIVLDIFFMGPLNMGIQGAAIATVIGYCIPVVFGMVYFTFHRSGSLSFMKPEWSLKPVAQSCANGAAQMVSNLSTAVATFLFNITVLKYIGEDGVAAISILLYAQYIFTAVYLGYSSGVAPIFSYKYGDHDTVQLKGLLKNSLIFIGICSVLSFGISLLGAGTITSIFAPAGTPIYDISVHGFRFFSVGFLFMGMNLFTSAFFTAISDGKTASLLSTLRTLVFLTSGIIFLPQMFGVTGIWLSVPCAELLALALSVFCLYRKRGLYEGTAMRPCHANQ